jgi:hypothetical protein
VKPAYRDRLSSLWFADLSAIWEGAYGEWRRYQELHNPVRIDYNVHRIGKHDNNRSDRITVTVADYSQCTHLRPGVPSIPKESTPHSR